MKTSSKPKKQLTPKKKSKKTSKYTQKRSPNKTPKTTPNKGRSPYSRTLPKSPISESMRQLNIKDFFKPITPSVPSIELLDCLHTSTITVTETDPQIGVNSIEPNGGKRRKPRRDLPLSPIFGSHKRCSLRLSKKFKSSDSKQRENNSFNESIGENDLLYKTAEEVIDLSLDNKTEYLTAVEFIDLDTNVGNNCEVIENSKPVSQSNPMVNELRVCENQTISSNSQNIGTDSNYSAEDILSNSKNDLNENKRIDCIFDKIEVNSNENIGNESEDELESIFKRPKSVVLKPNNDSMQNIGQYVDKEKDKKLKYFLKNLSRIQRDKQMLVIQPIDQFEFNNEVISEETIAKKSDIFVKPFKGIDIFCKYIPKIIKKYSKDHKSKDLTKKLKNLFELPINRLLPSVPNFAAKLDESERQLFISHLIKLVSTEECLLIDSKIIGLLIDNESEVYLSVILKDFYQILDKISVNLNELNELTISDQNTTKQQIDKNLNCLTNVIQMITQVLNNCSFKIEGIDVKEELIELLVIAFGLGLDYRRIESVDWIHDLKLFIANIIKHLFLDESNSQKLIDKLVLFYNSDDKRNIKLNLEIASLFPLDLDFELKRKFYISVVRLFVPKELIQLESESDYTLNAFHSIFTQIDWKALTPEDVQTIVQLFDLSLDLPKDLLNFRETISDILTVLSSEVDTSITKASEYEMSSIHKLLMILKSKVNGSTKRF